MLLCVTVFASCIVIFVLYIAGDVHVSSGAGARTDGVSSRDAADDLFGSGSIFYYARAKQKVQFSKT